jgi:outer membrane protein OmpA-like peptidoglycan-associated protein
MKRHPWILAGSALGLLMASAPLGAYPLQGDIAPLRSDARPIIRIQADCPEGAEDCAQGQHGKKRQHRDNDNNEGAAPRQNERGQRKKQQREAAPVEQQAPAPQAEQPRQDEQPKPRKQRQKQAEPAPAQQQQPAAKEQPAREKQAEPQAEQPKPRKQRQKQAEPAPQAQPAPTGEQNNGAKPATRQEKLRDYLNKKKNGEQPAQKQAQPKPQQPENGKPAGSGDSTGEATPQPKPKPGQKGEPAQQPDNSQASQPESKQEKLRDYLDKKKRGERPEKGQRQEGQPGQQAQPGQQEQPGGQAQPDDGARPQPPQPGQGKAAGEKPAAGNQANGKPAKPELPADTRPQVLPKGTPNAQPLPDNAAPLTDSGKRAGNRHERGGKNERGERPRNQPPEGKPGPLPQSDSAAQDRIRRHDRIESVEAVQGKRIDRDRWRDEWRKRREDRHDRDDGTVVKEIDNRVIVKYGDNIYVDNRGTNRRLERHARDSYVEELPDGFSRYTIVKDDGARVVTIRNADGDIVRRSRIMPDNREIVLYYVPEDDYGNIRRGYVDAGADLPPLVLDIPANQYILDAQSAEPDDYYTYLDAPPVEPVERIYSVDEVVHSARIRDKVRRVDLDTITFDTGSAEIGENQVDKLEALGDAINRILKDNPAETFLIEGHTDAVGSDESNLVLSDERAQSVAEALTSVFNIPAENLTTQGYGEEYLKIDTEDANRENRRVAVRRITPLVAPVASAQ